MNSDGMFSRRRLLWSSGAALALSNSARAVTSARGTALANTLSHIAGQPSAVTVFAEDGAVPLRKNGMRWEGPGLEVGTVPGAEGLALTLAPNREAVLRVHVRWAVVVPVRLRYLADAWERSYGDLTWRGMEPERVMPWYFLAFDGATTLAGGVKSGAAAFCFWQVDPAGVSLWLDIRNGGKGLRLQKRELRIATVIAAHYRDTKPFAAARQFCRKMCGAPRLPKKPVYGGNNWYYAYGNSSAGDIRDDSKRIASFAESLENRPFMVIDDGWQPNPTAGPWLRGNAKFPDMARLAEEMRGIGVQPGLWMRPLFTKQEIPAGWRLRSPRSAHEYSVRKGYVIDPTVPEASEQIQADMRRAVGWGYGLVKHDFSTYDLLGRWGKDMGAAITDADWSFADTTRTNAEIIREFYRTLREAAGNTLIEGCNTVGHLTAGLFEMQRSGDDTSGRDWNRTRKMGVNTLAFRAPQHGTFFAIDADCVGLTKQIPWDMNAQWLKLLAGSGTPLFVSAAPDAVGPEQRAAIQSAFAQASRPMTIGEAVDWLESPEPETWMLQGKKTQFDWFGSEGASPFAV